MPQPPPETPFRSLPKPLQRALEQFAGLPGPDRTAARLASLVDGHLAAWGLADEALRARHQSCAFDMASRRFGIHAERRAAARDTGRGAAA